jgi:hypothetical protein
MGRKYNNLKKNSVVDYQQPQLMPPIFTMMYQYMKNKNIKHLNDDDLNDFLENNFKQRLPGDYVKLCSKLFNDTDSSYYKIEGIHDRIDSLKCKNTDRLLFMNFKSFEILNKDNRDKFFEIISETSPDVICLTEVLVPTKFTEDNLTGKVCNLNDYLEYDRIEHPMSDSETKFAEFKRSLYKKEKIKRKYTKEYDPDIDIDELGNVVLTNVWIKFFLDNGYNFIIFGNPTDCPYGKNWGNCIISKRKPTSCNIIQLDSRKIHKKTTDLVDKNDVESRCMLHITMDEHHILCTHLDDSDSDVRIKQTEQIIEYMKKLPKGKIQLNPGKKCSLRIK